LRSASVVTRRTQPALAMKNINVLFVCTGNICRSPLAEYLLRSRLKTDSSWNIGSAGLSAAEGLPASLVAVKVAAKIGVDLGPHHSRLLTDELIDGATIILAMTNAHIWEIKTRFPGARDRVHLLGAFNRRNPNRDILDPIGGNAEIYQKTMGEISDCLGGLIEYLRSYEKSV